MPGDFGSVLDRFGKDRWVLAEGEICSACTQRLSDANHAEIGIDANLLTRQFAERGLKLIAVSHGHGIAQMLSYLWGDLFWRDEQFCVPIGMGDHIGQGDRRVRHIAAPNVEQPCNRIERRDDHRIEPLCAQPIRHIAAFSDEERPASSSVCTIA